MSSLFSISRLTNTLSDLLDEADQLEVDGNGDINKIGGSTTEEIVENQETMLFSSGQSGQVELPEEYGRLKKELEEKYNEVKSLKAVWEETRSKLAKVSSVLSQKEEVHKEAILKLEHSFQLERDNHQVEVQKERDNSRSLLADKFVDLENLKRLLEDEKSNSLSLTEKILSLEAEKSSGLFQSNVETETLTKTIRSLREELVTRQREMDEERKVLQNSHLSFREAALSSTTPDVTQLSTALRELAEKTSQLSSVSNRLRWVSTDYEALKAELESEKSSRAFEVEQNKQKLDDLVRQLKFSKEEEKKLSKLLQEEKEKKIVHPVQVSTAVPDDSLGRIELEKKLNVMAEYLMQKQTTIERLISEKGTLKLSLETEQRRVQSLTQEVRQLKEVDIDEDLENGKGGLKPRPLNSTPKNVPSVKSAPVQRAVSVLDSLGNSLAVLLRRAPAIRVMIVFYHFLHHSDININPPKM